MQRLIEVRGLPDFQLFLRYDDGTAGTLALAPRFRGPMFEPLRDPAYFVRVALSPDGAPSWPNGLDLAPDALYERLRSGDNAQGAA